MPSTSVHALRYPAASDAPNVPQYIQNLATDVDAKLPRIKATQTVAYGTSPTTDKTMIVQAFSVVVATNAGGDTTISYPSAFPSGLASITTTSGDIAAGLHAYSSLISANTSSVNLRCFQPTGSVCASVSVRINVIAVGW